MDICGYTTVARVCLPTHLHVDICMVVFKPPFGGDWFRQGSSEVGSRSWSPRHVKQGYRQIELTTITLMSLSWLLLLN